MEIFVKAYNVKITVSSEYAVIFLNFLTTLLLKISKSKFLLASIKLLTSYESVYFFKASVQ
jgi:hypothetical protein